MGWETLAMVGFQALINRSAHNAAKKQAKGVIQEGEYVAGNKARDTLRATGRLTTQFLQSGLTLEGGPSEAISQAFQAGYRDIGRIKSNYNTQAKNIMNAQRTKALEGYGKMIAGAGIGSSVGSMFGGGPESLGGIGGYSGDITSSQLPGFDGSIDLGDDIVSGTGGLY